jgi:hypothetical protein
MVLGETMLRNREDAIYAFAPRLLPLAFSLTTKQTVSYATQHVQRDRRVNMHNEIIRPTYRTTKPMYRMGSPNKFTIFLSAKSDKPAVISLDLLSFSAGFHIIGHAIRTVVGSAFSVSYISSRPTGA